MRSMFRMVLGALLAVFALSAVAASSASAAPEWYVKKGGVFKKVTEPVKVVFETPSKSTTENTSPTGRWRSRASRPLKVKTL
jgi:sulfite exporter TauE/SafE